MFSLESQPLLEMSSFSVLPAKVNHDFNGTMCSLSPHGLRLSFQNLWLCPCSFLCLEAVVTGFLSMNSCEQSMHPLLQRMCLLLNALSNASTQNAHFQLRYTFIAMWIFLWGISVPQWFLFTDGNKMALVFHSLPCLSQIFSKEPVNNWSND